MQVDEPEEPLTMRRSRRSTAGNRMQAAMAEMALEEVKDEEDADFTNDNDEEDIFDDDFESTASEAESAPDIKDEEKRTRRATRTRWERAANAAHARNKATFQPEHKASPPSSPPKTRQTRRGVSISEPATENKNRQSKRKHTVLSRTLTESRLKQSEEQRKAAQQAKKPRQQARMITQAELIARALDAEEGNIIEHRDYLKDEEEKRQRARVVRQVVKGPLVRWLSRTEDVQTLVNPYAPLPHSSTSIPPVPTVVHVQKSSRNYVVHEQTQQPGSPPPTNNRNADTHNKPSWGSTMTAMFGAHVNWEEMQVYSGTDRPLTRPTPTCPITGRLARYCDPQTGVPFADLEAYQSLQRVLNHEFIWNSSLGAYVGHGAFSRR
ncbi:YL1-C domain-containing protein [Mycena indigotica]|uniref:YL1-C domain-containing protein n=1 Tax=Mycena indigotica TaxID=2126181 RepID=A0A8H6WD73_9AGAR|nr:YL1-C domain-containing protein [Mycena indigotica]KAF7312196.1 YL1-C domain-containing protein [Mycena indigotica]